MLNDIYFIMKSCYTLNVRFMLYYQLINHPKINDIPRCYISGERKGQSEVFIDGLPGYVDNIRRRLKFN